jgi:DNA-directed RNA polymerase specialized sigma24 family protein
MSTCPVPAAAASTHYADNAELRVLAQQARELGRVPYRLAELLYKIADGYLQKFGGIPADDVDDFRQDLLIHWIEKALPRIFERGGNPFAYLTEAAKNFATDWREAAAKEVAAATEFNEAAEYCGNLYSVDKPHKFRPQSKPKRKRKR